MNRQKGRSPRPHSRRYTRMGCHGLWVQGRRRGNHFLSTHPQTVAGGLSPSPDQNFTPRGRHRAQQLPPAQDGVAAGVFPLALVRGAAASPPPGVSRHLLTPAPAWG